MEILSSIVDHSIKTREITYTYRHTSGHSITHLVKSEVVIKFPLLLSAGVDNLPCFIIKNLHQFLSIVVESEMVLYIGHACDISNGRLLLKNVVALKSVFYESRYKIHEVAIQLAILLLLLLYNRNV